MRRGFTMIELIFVIVIIGILAAVAIPKLAATRSDAEAAKIANNLATCVNDAGGQYIKTSRFSGDNNKTDKLPSSQACDPDAITTQAGEKCYSIVVNDANGTMSIDENGSSSTCSAAHKNSRQGGTSENNATKVIKF